MKRELQNAKERSHQLASPISNLLLCFVFSVESQSEPEVCEHNPDRKQM